MPLDRMRYHTFPVPSVTPLSTVTATYILLLPSPECDGRVALYVLGNVEESEGVQPDQAVVGLLSEALRAAMATSLPDSATRSDSCQLAEWNVVW